jgi:hypothetical protein
MGAVKVNELMTSAAKWFRQECDAEDEESDAFRDMIVCGMGWTETRLDYEDNPAGDPKIERTDPLEMVWDSSAKKRNLADKRRVFHIRRDVPIDEARALCPGDHFEDATIMLPGSMTSIPRTAKTSRTTTTASFTTRATIPAAMIAATTALHWFARNGGNMRRPG